MKALAIITLVAWLGTTGTTLHAALTPCPTEDSVFCYWDGATRGNGEGESFIALTETLSLNYDADTDLSLNYDADSDGE